MFSADLPVTNICLHAKFKFGGVMVLAVQLFNKIKEKKKKNLCSCAVYISHMLCQNTLNFIFGKFVLFCML